MRTRVKAGWLSGLTISAIAATIFTLVQFGDLVLPRPSLGQVTGVSLRVPYGAAHAVDGKSHYFVPAGTMLLHHDVSHQRAVAYERSRLTVSGMRAAGAWALFFAFTFTLASYLNRFGQNRLKLLRVQIGLFTLLVLTFVAVKFQLMFSTLSEFWMPIAAVPLWVATSFDRRTALVLTVVTSFILASLLRFDLLVLGVMLAHGMGSILLFLDRKHTRSMLWSGALAGLSSAGVLVAMMWTLEGGFDIWLDLKAGGASQLLGCVGGGFSGGVLAALLHSPAERLLGHVPRERLHDLTDLEQPLLKHMAKHAPGSWEHSRAMANLAEQAASAIGIDALLVRVGAYYHDLGKSVRPKFFVENLAHKERTPHDDLTPYESAQVIRTHVEEGAKILRDGGIPEPVVEFCYTHHGTQLVEYFWNRCKERGNPDNRTEEDFRYPGMKPQTKETAILMLVDSIEAASRTIDPPEKPQFEIMIQRVLFTKLASGQLDECGLSLADLNVIVTRVADTLVNMHHHRIKYPWQAKQAEEFGVPAQAVSEAPAARAKDAEPEREAVPKTGEFLTRH
jgi:cyclic-di-AMP phosphodiesterase PgpH